LIICFHIILTILTNYKLEKGGKMSENLKITDCGALTEIQNQLEQFSPRGSWHVLRNMENSLGKKIKVLSERRKK